MTGRAKGGHARAAALEPQRRSEIAKAAALARWKGPRSTPMASLFVRALKKHRDRIAKERDALREIESDISSLADTADEAIENLESAIIVLSQYA